MPAKSDHSLTQRLKDQARHLGFALVGVTTAVQPARLHHFYHWLESGYAGQMHYLKDRWHAYQHPNSMLEGCSTLVMLGLPYLSSETQRSNQPTTSGKGKVARYAQCGSDYHDVIRGKLKQLRRWLIDACPGCNARGVVDTAPLLEREFAEAAGLGWVGKNTLLLNRQWGSYFFLAALLTNIELEVDSATTAHCGSCTACLDKCPTQAIVQPYILDANRCLSYVTIESPELPPDDVSRLASGWLFGCDICQEVCPWNRRSLCTEDPNWQPEPTTSEIDLLEVLSWSDQQFEMFCRHTPLWRARRRGMVRNALLLVGSQKHLPAVQATIGKLQDSEPLIRAAAVWALGEIDSAETRAALHLAVDQESDADIRQSMIHALCKTASRGTA